MSNTLNMGNPNKKEKANQIIPVSFILINQKEPEAWP